MSEVVKLQLIGLCVVGSEPSSSCSSRGNFSAGSGWSRSCLGLFALVALAVLQMASASLAEESINIAGHQNSADGHGDDRAKIFFSKGPRSAIPLAPRNCRPDLKPVWRQIVP